MTETILEIKNLKTYFYTEEGTIPAVDGLDLTLHKGETLAIVGESGCGKSVTSLSVLRIFASPPGKIIDGEIFFHDKDLLKLTESEMQEVRGKNISMIFQEPLTSLNPVLTIGFQMIESFQKSGKRSKHENVEKSIEMLRLVGIPSPEKVVNEYPHQLSGGMRQRVMIAMALACRPDILIADEPTTALDVTIQAQILELLGDIKAKVGTSIILITHDLGIVAQIAQNVVVMYAGQAVEYGDILSLFKNPLHPYTVGLLKSIPMIGTVQEKLYNIPGVIPSPKNYPTGCRFSARCEKAFEKCFQKSPPLFNYSAEKRVRCWKYEKGDSADG